MSAQLLQQPESGGKREKLLEKNVLFSSKGREEMGNGAAAEGEDRD